MHRSTKTTLTSVSIDSRNPGQRDSSVKYSLVPTGNIPKDRNQNTIVPPSSSGASKLGWINPSLSSESPMTRTVKTDSVTYDMSRIGMRAISNSYNPSNYSASAETGNSDSNIGWSISSTTPAVATSSSSVTYSTNRTPSYPYPPRAISTTVQTKSILTPGKTEFYTPSTLPSYPPNKTNNYTGKTPNNYPSSGSPTKTPSYSPSPNRFPSYPPSKTPSYPPSPNTPFSPPTTKTTNIHPIKTPTNPPPPSSKTSFFSTIKIPNVTPTKAPAYVPNRGPVNPPSKTPTKAPAYSPNRGPVTSPSKSPSYPPSTRNNFTNKNKTPILSQPSKVGRHLSRFGSTASLYKLGEKGSGLRARGNVQDFHQLRADLLSSGELFEDNEFPAVDSSIFFSKTPPRPFEWKRPIEICSNPKLFVDGATRFDVQQGELGDCWLLAAVANLTLSKGLFAQIVPDDQGFGDQYAGIFHFRFWQYGRWVDVVIDDRLPTYYGKLVFLHSSETNEFWSALLEKAYAKLHGSYEALKGGSTCEAMEDFTGGVTEMYEMKEAPPNLYMIMLKAYERSSLMGCSIEPDPEVLEAQTRDGLVKGHAYSITRVKYVDIETPNSSGKIPLIRLRNPWGNDTEWNGAWSDKSAEWRFIPQSEKDEIGLTFEHDGEFWMSYQDFKAKFTRLEICNLNPDSLVDEDETGEEKRKWEMSMFEGEWVRNVTAGGCRNFLETFWHNPQYNITLTDPDEDDDDSKCTVIVALMQKNRRSQRRMGMECLTIGFAMYHLSDPDNLPTPLDMNFFKYNASVARSPSFINLREVSCRFKLPPGSYCIVPSTFEAKEEGEFILRVFSENKNNMSENDEEVGLGKVDQRVLWRGGRRSSKSSNTSAIINAPEPEEDRSQDKVKEFFRKIAGDDMEVDWMELKEILDYAMRSELPSGNPQGGGGILNSLMTLVCGSVCKDTPFAQVFETQDMGFSKDVCRSMVAMMDVDRSGKLGFEEFKSLWADIRNWKGVFKLYDKDGSKCLNAFELRQALNSAGYIINNHILNILAHRYSTKDGLITFDDFMMCAVRLKAMIDIFKERDPDSTNTASFTMEEWVEKTLYS